MQGLATMDPSSLLKQPMDDWFEILGVNERHLFQKHASDDPDDWRSASQTQQQWEVLPIPRAQSNNQLGINNGVVPNQTNVVTAQASKPTNTILNRNSSCLSEPDRAQRKKIIDLKYRQRCKKEKENMQFSLEKLTGENESLKKENESLKKDNASMHGTLTEQTKEIERLRNDLCQLKCEYEQQNVLVQTLSMHLADPLRIENEKLKDENASLRKNANLNNSLLAEENAKLKIENRVLKVQNDALCGKIISDNDKKPEQKQ